MSAQIACTCLRGAQPRPTHRQKATFADAARHMVGMRLSALHLPLGAGGESIGFVVGKARARKRVARTISFIRPRALARRRGTTRSVVEGAGSLRASSHLPLPARSRAPPPRARGPLFGAG